MPLPEAPPRGRLPFEPPAAYPQELREYWTLWRQERFWACHEVLEERWRTAPAPHRWFLGGLINGAVAVFQHRRGNAVGAARQLRRAQVKLESFRPRYQDLDVDAYLGAIAREIQDSLARLSPAQRAALAEVEDMVRRRMNPPPGRTD